MVRVELSVSKQRRCATLRSSRSAERWTSTRRPPCATDSTSCWVPGRASSSTSPTSGFLDSTGLGALVAARTTASEHGASLPLVCTHQRILKLFTITGLDGVFRIHPTVDDALERLDSAG